jgi:GDSL-like Lipase/Acylhydrolase
MNRLDRRAPNASGSLIKNRSGLGRSGRATGVAAHSCAATVKAAPQAKAHRDGSSDPAGTERRPLLGDQALSSFEEIDGPRLHRLDVWKLAEQVRADPAAAGFVNAWSPCAGRGDCEGYLFWDDVHPTTQAHQRLAEAAIRVLSPSREGCQGG